MATGPSTSQTPYLVPSSSVNSTVTLTSIISAGDTLPGSGKKFVGIPDGIGAFDNGDGTITILLNHELGDTAGIVRDHGSIGAFVERLVVDINTLAVVSDRDLVTSPSNVFTTDAATGTIYTAGTTAWARFCSGNLADQSAFFDAASGLGTTNKIYMTGEENGPPFGAYGRGFAFVLTGTDANKAFELPRLGNLSYENLVASPNSGAKTVVMMEDDTSPRGQVYVYVGDKQASGNDIDKAGLTNGKFYGITVAGLIDEAANTTLPASGAAFSLTEIGPSGNVAAMDGTQIQNESEAKNVTEFLRPEDGAWDTINPNRYYFVTTDAITSPSKLWALDFNDVKNPLAGGTIKLLLDGSEGQVMMDNITVGVDGHVVICEDPGNSNRAAKVWDYNPLADSLTEVSEHDFVRFGVPTAPFNVDEESSGVFDVTSLFNRAGKMVYLIDTQAHYAIAGPDGVVEGGQLQLMVIDRTVNGTSGNDTFNGTAEAESYNGLGGNDTITGGPGNDLLNGGGGDDTTVFNFKLTDAKISFANNGIVLTGPDGRDVLLNFEHYKFTDGTVDTNDGNPLVDDLFYYITNPDVWAAHMDADAHFAQFGWKEGRNPNAFFDTKAYLNAYADVKAAGVNPLAHYAQSGAAEGRDPGIGFDTDKYLAANHDVAVAHGNPLEHYLAFGLNEGRFTYGDGLFN
jgi:hypothetical protein